MSENTAYDTIQVTREGRVGIITLNRPKALNALNEQTMVEVLDAATAMDRDPEVGAIILTGSEKAFAAGADIKEMATKSATDMFRADFFSDWDRFAALRTPKIAAVSGYALGGGCELAMMCDLIVAADTAQFGQPEITLGVVPGMGGTQRLTRAVGKAKAMDMILTGRRMKADEAERSGLVARVVPVEELQATALEMATTIAGMSKPVAQHAVELVNSAYETTLHQGLHEERRTFHALFSTHDQSEGMASFAEKRKATFTHE